jgi:hypothetical protein
MEINIPSTAGGAASSLMQFTKNGSTVNVNLDTGTPANSNAIPVNIIDSLGNIVNVGQGLMAASLPVVIASNQSAISVTLPANQSVNLAQIVGTATATGNGVASAGCQRVTIASDNTAFAVNATLQTGANVIGSLVANQSVNIAQMNGVTVLMGAGNTGTGSQRVTIASDQAAVATKAPVNANGSYAEITNLTTSAQTFTAPANAVGFILMALGDNGVNLRWKIGATATTTAGVRLEPGRDTGYIPCAANISIIAESSTNQSAEVQWILSA